MGPTRHTLARRVGHALNAIFVTAIDYRSDDGNGTVQSPLLVSMSQPQPSFVINGLPIKPSEIPSEDAIIDAGKEILAASANWKPGKTFQKVVKTCTYSPDPKDEKGGKKWACRSSEHSSNEGTFDEFWNGLGTNKAGNEME